MIRPKCHNFVQQTGPKIAPNPSLLVGHLQIVGRLLLLVVLLAPGLVHAQLAGAAWMKNRGNSLNAGIGQAAGALDVVKWTFYAGAVKDFTTSPAVDSNNQVYVAATDGHTYSIDGVTGNVNWSVPTGGVSLSSPALDAHGALYIGTDAGLLYKLDCLTASTIWVVTVNPSSPQPLGPPAIGADGTIYVTASDAMYAVEPTQGKVLWSQGSSHGVKGLGPAETPAIGKDGTLYVGGDSTLYALNPTSGAVIWSDVLIASDFSFTYSPAIGADGTVYIVAKNMLFAVNGSKGKTIWSYEVIGIANNSPAVGPDGTIYFTAGDNNLYAVAQDGSWRWQYNGSRPFSSPPILGSDGTVFVGSYDESMYAINGSDGSLVWNYNTGGDTVYEAAIGPDGSLYYGSGNGKLYGMVAGLAITALTFKPNPVVGGGVSIGTVWVNNPPQIQTKVMLSCDTAGVSVPASIYILPGQSSADFVIRTPLVVAEFKARVTATINGLSRSAILTLQPLQITGLTVVPGAVTGGMTATGTLTLNGPAPPAGFVASVFGNNNAISMAATVTVPPGKSSVDFPINTKPVTATQYTTVTANLNGASIFTAPLNVNPSVLKSISFDPPKVAGGNTSTGTVALTGVAPAAGLKITFSNNSTAVGVPSSVTIAAGQTSVTFTAHTAVVTDQAVATIVASLGSITKAATLTVNPAAIQSITLNPSTVNGKGASTATVTLSGPAPKAGLKVTLSSDQDSAIVPASLQIPAGKTSGTFVVRTDAVAAKTTAKIGGTTGTTSASAPLTINAPALTGVSLSPASVSGGKNSMGSVTISMAAPKGGLIIALSCDQSAASPPATVTILEGHTSATFTVKTKTVQSKTTAKVSGSFGGVTKSANLTIS